jgi:phosphate starvation-inducible protein PhoH
MIICGDDHQVDLKSIDADSGFRFLYKASRKVKNLSAITLKKNHRDPIVEDLIEYYEDAHSNFVSIKPTGSRNKR